MAHAYRVFPVSDDGHVIGPAVIIEAADDAEALGFARRTAEDGAQAVEVWQAARRLRCIEPPTGCGRPRAERRPRDWAPAWSAGRKHAALGRATRGASGR